MIQKMSLNIAVMYANKDSPTRDHKNEMISMVKAVQQIPDKGEKKVYCAILVLREVLNHTV